MKFWSDSPTDAQYIELIRKRVRDQNRYRYPIVVASLALAAGSYGSMSYLGQWLMPGRISVEFNVTFVVTGIIGILIALIFIKTVHAAKILRGPRSDRMLIECWDKMKDGSGEVSVPPHDSDYIELIRNRIHRRTWRQYFEVLAGLALMGLMAPLCDWRPPDRWKPEFHNAHLIAVILGPSTGLVFLIAMYLLTDARIEQRSDRLLIECWDKLKSSQ